MQFSTNVRNAIVDAIETAIGPSPTLAIRTGAAPANCAAPDSGTVLSTIAMPADWMEPAANGAKELKGNWSDTADALGNAAHYRIYGSGGACEEQGTVTGPGGGGDIEVQNVSFAPGQPFSITQKVYIAPNA